MSAVAWTSIVADAVKDYIVADVRNRAYFGAAGGATVALIALNYFDRRSSSQKQEGIYLNEKVVGKTLLVGVCAAAGGALGLISTLRS